MKKALLTILGVLLIAIVTVYLTLIRAPYAPENCTFALDMSQLRALAVSIPGDKPTEIRVEDISGATMPQAVAVAGAAWDKVPFRAYAYQLVFADKTIIVDTAMDRTQADKGGMHDNYNDDGWKRLAKGMTEASAIYVTHEHFDHMGGAVASDAWAKNLRLTPAQLDADTPNRAPVSATTRSAASTLTYSGMTAVAPGVVLIEARGHTPGSQMVFVSRADGTEVILTGDTAWLMANIERQQGPAKLVFFFLRNGDRAANACQLAALDHVRQSELSLAIMPGHDIARMQALIAKGVFTPQFR
jgi:glyoxylase-like metal-dependent hydrolase (beta-lactamase superfamily II)